MNGKFIFKKIIHFLSQSKFQIDLRPFDNNRVQKKTCDSQIIWNKFQGNLRKCYNIENEWIFFFSPMESKNTKNELDLGKSGDVMELILWK